MCVESDGAAYNVDIALPSTLPQTLAQADHVDVYEPSYAENKSDRPKHKSKSKKYRSTDDMASATKVIETVDDDVPPQKVQKKKKRKKRTTVSDAETNTSQVMNLELVPRKIPPPRLEPIKADVLQNAISTPPLRSKFVDDEVHGDSLTRPPSGVSAERRRKHRASNDISHGEPLRKIKLICLQIVSFIFKISIISLDLLFAVLCFSQVWLHMYTGSS